MRKRVAVALCATAALGLTGGSAFAGEMTGNGKWIAGSEEAAIHGKSECAYSGQNDEFHLFPNEGWPRTVVGGHVGVPGFALQPHGRAWIVDRLVDLGACRGQPPFPAQARRGVGRVVLGKPCGPRPGPSCGRERPPSGRRPLIGPGENRRVSDWSRAW